MVARHNWKNVELLSETFSVIIKFLYVRFTMVFRLSYQCLNVYQPKSIDNVEYILYLLMELSFWTDHLHNNKILFLWNEYVYLQNKILQYLWSMDVMIWKTKLQNKHTEHHICNLNADVSKLLYRPYCSRHLFWMDTISSVTCCSIFVK